MINVNSFFKIDEKFVSINNFHGSLPDLDYIEGGIEISIDNIILLNKDTWDYIDQLWAYILDGLVALTQGENFHTYFPDQPVELEFIRKTNNFLLVSITINETQRASVNEIEFLTYMAEEANNFFHILMEIQSEKKILEYDIFFKKIDTIKKHCSSI